MPLIFTMPLNSIEAITALSHMKIKFIDRVNTKEGGQDQMNIIAETAPKLT